LRTPALYVYFGARYINELKAWVEKSRVTSNVHTCVKMRFRYEKSMKTCFLIRKVYQYVATQNA